MMTQAVAHQFAPNHEKADSHHWSQGKTNASIRPAILHRMADATAVHTAAMIITPEPVKMATRLTAWLGLSLPGLAGSPRRR